MYFKQKMGKKKSAKAPSMSPEEYCNAVHAMMVEQHLQSVGIGEIGSSGPCVSKPLVISDLPSSLYLLVDREVELKGTPVKDFSELGAVAAEEEERKAIALFANPRQAKRQCGRSQRVIKVPDTGLLERTAPFILAQGISRVVLDSTLYALPGS